MACGCGVKEGVLLFFFYKICNRKRDYEIEEHVEEVDALKAKADEVDRLKTMISEVEEEAEEYNWSKTYALRLFARHGVNLLLLLGLKIRLAGLCILINVLSGASPTYGFYDPIEKKKTKAMSLPEFSGVSVIIYSNDWWLLMKDYRNVDLFFFINPFTRTRINLPRFGSDLPNFAFSCAHTRNGCVVFGI